MAVYAVCVCLCARLYMYVCMANLTDVGLQQVQISMPTGLHCLLVGAIDYILAGRNCKVREAWNGSEAQSHDEGKGERSVTGVHWSVMGVQYKCVTEGMEKRVGTEV